MKSSFQKSREQRAWSGEQKRTDSFFTATLTAKKIPFNMCLIPKYLSIEVFAKVTYTVIPANPGSSPGQAPESRIA